MCLYSIIVFDLSVEYEGLWISVLVCFLFFTIVLFLQHLLHPLHIHQFMFLGYIVVESMCLGYVIFICHLLRSLSVSPFMSLFLSGLSVQSPWFHPSLHLDVWCSHVLITPRFILIAPRLLCTVLSLLPLSCFTPISFSCVPICPIIWLVCMYCLSVPLTFVTSSVMPCALSPCVMFNEVESFRLYLNLHSISIPCPLSQISQYVVYRVVSAVRSTQVFYSVQQT